MAPNFLLYACVDAQPGDLPKGILDEPLRAVPVGDLFVIGGTLSDPRALGASADRMKQHDALLRALQAKLPAVMPVFFGTIMDEARLDRLDPAHLRSELERVKALDAMQVDLWGNAKRMPKRPRRDTKKPAHPPTLPEREWLEAAAEPFAKGGLEVVFKYIDEALAAAPTWVQQDAEAAAKLDVVVAVATQQIARGKHAPYKKALEAAAKENKARITIEGPRVAFGLPFKPKPAPVAPAPVVPEE